MTSTNPVTTLESNSNGDTFKNVSLKKSVFLHAFSKEDKVCLFHSLTQHKVFGASFLLELFDLLEKPHTFQDIQTTFSGRVLPLTLETAYLDLVKKNMLITDNEDDMETYKRSLSHGLIKQPIQHMYFLPTTVCNLRCGYCFVEDSNKTQPLVNMTRVTCRKALDVFAKLTENAEKISLALYGGEPLCNRDVVFDALRYVRKLEQEGAFKKEVELSMLTNGVLIDDKAVEVIRETQTGVSISWDGPDKCHDIVRLDTNKHPTGKSALNAFHLLKDAGLTPGISCTIHRHNVDRVPEIARYIAEQLEPPGMGFNLLLPLISSGNPLDVSHEFAVEQLIEAFKILRKHGIYEDRIMRRVKPFVERGFHYKDCMGVGGQIVITPDGRIGPCQGFVGLDDFFPLHVKDLHSRLPDLDEDDIYADPLFDEWNQRLPLNMSECWDCFAISVCGGGCPYASYANHDSIWRMDERICHQAKNVLEWMVWETHDLMSE